MNMDNMTTYVSPLQVGDYLWFLGWKLSSVGAMVWTCIALLVLLIADR